MLLVQYVFESALWLARYDDLEARGGLEISNVFF